MLIQLINTVAALKPEEYTRAWVEIGQLIQLPNQCLLKVLEHSTDSGRMLQLNLSVGHCHHTWPLKAGGFADASKQANLLVMPRAAEIGEDGRTLRVFLDFVDSTPNQQLILGEFI